MALSKKKPVKKAQGRAKKSPEEQFPKEWLPPKPGELFKVWATMTNSDSMEGRGVDRPIAFFKTKEEALAYGKGKNTMGSNGKATWYWATYDVDGTLWRLEHEIELRENEEAIKLAKAHEKVRKYLSEEELELLGIKALA